MKKTIQTIRGMKVKGERIACLTAYDALFASFMEDAEMDLVLVGDSVGMVFSGYDTTIPVTVEDMIYHTCAVRRTMTSPLLVSDMPFMSYQASPEQALKNAGRLMKEGHAEAVKMEGGRRIAEQIRLCTESGIPVMGHLGMTPQSVHEFGGFKLQARTREEAEHLRKDALAVQKAGAFALVLEKIPADLATEITADLEIPTIGIGAGPGTDGQILVTYDMLGLYEKFKPKFVRRYLEAGKEIKNALSDYIHDVKENNFPDSGESY